MNVKEVLSGFGLVAVVVVVLVLCSFGGWIFRRETADYFGHGNAQMTAQAAPMQYAVYQEFFNICTSIQNNEGQLDAMFAAPHDLPNWDYNVAALQGLRRTGIHQYNNNATQHSALGRGQFQAANLPYQIPDEPYTGENPTICGT